MSEITNTEDPCAIDNPASRWAFVWFFCVIIGGGFFVYKLYQADTWMYVNNGQFLNYDDYRSNRSAQTSVAVGHVDSRRFPKLTTSD